MLYQIVIALDQIHLSAVSQFGRFSCEVAVGAGEGDQRYTTVERRAQTAPQRAGFGRD